MQDVSIIKQIQSRKKHKYIDSEEEDEQPLPQAEATPPKVQETLTIDSKRYQYLFEPDTSEGEAKPAPKKKEPQPEPKIKKQDAIPKQLEDLRYEILIRWWYCFEEWPPKDYDYGAELRKYNLRQVDLATFKKDSPTDDHGNFKVYEVQGFKGVFRTKAGDTLDLRPKDTCPSYENLEKMNVKTLPKLYIKGLKAQLKDLVEHEPNNKSLQKSLQEQIEFTNKTYQRYLE